jgi:hypothetical protein
MASLLTVETGVDRKFVDIEMLPSFTVWVESTAHERRTRISCRLIFTHLLSRRRKFILLGYSQIIAPIGRDESCVAQRALAVQLGTSVSEAGPFTSRMSMLYSLVPSLGQEMVYRTI